MKTFCIIILLFFCFSLKAQLLTGVKGGLSIPNLEGNSEQSQGYKSGKGVYGGIFLIFPITTSLSLQPEVNFSPQGGQRKGMQQVPTEAISGISLPAEINLYANFNTITVLNYLEFPILARFKLGQKIKYFACVGPHIAFLIEAKTKTNGVSPIFFNAAGTIPLSENGTPLPPVSFNAKTNIKESIKKVNAGVQGGLGFEYPCGRGNIFLEGRAIIGITNIQIHPEIDGKNQTGSLAVALGYLIRIK